MHINFEIRWNDERTKHLIQSEIHGFVITCSHDNNWLMQIEENTIGTQQFVCMTDIDEAAQAIEEIFGGCRLMNVFAFAQYIFKVFLDLEVVSETSLSDAIDAFRHGVVTDKFFMCGEVM